MAIAETLAALSAAMQAVDFWEKHGGPRKSVLTTLNLRYQPELDKFREVEKTLRIDEPSNHKFWSDVFEGIDAEIEKCKGQFLDSIKDDDLMPQEREKLSRSWRACVCKNLWLIKDAAGGKRLPPHLDELWREFRCEERARRGFGDDSSLDNWRGGEVRRPIVG